MKQKYDFEKMEKKDDEISAVILRKAIANRISRLLICHTDIRPNYVTGLSFGFMIISSVLLLSGGYRYQLLGAFFALLFMIFDCVDGDIARVKGLESKLGEWLDGIVGFIALPLLMLALAFGIGTTLSLRIAPFAAIAYPMQYLIMRFYKLDIIGSKKPMKIAASEKYDFVRRVYGSTLFYLLLFFCALINRTILVLIFFATLGNLVWILTLALQYSNIRGKRSESNKA